MIGQSLLRRSQTALLVVRRRRRSASTSCLPRTRRFFAISMIVLRQHTRFTLHSRVHSLSPWFDAECRATRRECRRLEIRYRRSKSDVESSTGQRSLQHCDVSTLTPSQRRTVTGLNGSYLKGTPQRNCGSHSPSFFDGTKSYTTHRLHKPTAPTSSVDFSLRKSTLFAEPQKVVSRCLLHHRRSPQRRW